MKYFMVLIILLFSQPAYAQDTPPPQPRAFIGITQPESKKEALAAAKLRQPNVEIWLPPEFQSSEQKWPLLVFSHGFGGCAKQSTFLTEYLAEKGYIVIAPDHADAECRKNRLIGGGKLAETRQWPEKPFRNPETWTDKTEADRKDDVLFAVSSMLDDRQYAPYVDVERMGLIGHSLGGYTVLGIAGAWPSWKDKRFKAVLVLSPFISPFLRGKSLKNIDVPVMYQGGTKDTQITPLIKRRGGGYDQTPVPKYFLEFTGAGHFSFTELERGYHDIIRRTALDFMDKYVKGGEIVIDEEKKPQVGTFWKEEPDMALSP
jgi:predicted dienelactone hydrolase